MKYLLICSIGPVQDFIATARRSRDLWYGSWMLSELAKSAAWYIANTYGLDSLIFPAVKDIGTLSSGSEMTVPNKIVAIFDHPSIDFTKIHEVILTRLGGLRDEAFNSIEALRGKFNRQLASVQVDDLPEFYWVCVSYADEKAYPKARDQAEALLAARKNTRNFRQMIGTNNPKSSLDGSRESVIPEDAYPRGNNDPEADQKINQLFRRYHARPAERLSGIDLLKRIGSSTIAPKFKSTSHMAALPFLQRIEKERVGGSQKILEEIKKLLSGMNIEIDEQDGSILYESRLNEVVQSSEKQKELSRNLNEIINNYAGKWSSKLSPYYALLAADGDNMGKTIDNQLKADDHRNLSITLSEFAGSIKNIVETYQGIQIYAGGDDILAYLPLHNVIDCGHELRNKFVQQMRSYSFIDDKGTEIFPTLSMGIVIAHHLTPLSDVLELARNAEKKAKQIPGKNALAITLSKRSGSDRTIAGKWDEMDTRLKLIIKFIRLNAISTGTAYELQELHRTLSRTTIPVEGLQGEATRILQRKREPCGQTVINQQVISQFQNWMQKDNISLDELANEMIVAKIFAEAADLAGI